MLSKAALEAKRKYYRDYYHRNKEAAKAAHNRYWERKGEILSGPKESEEQK